MVRVLAGAGVGVDVGVGVGAGANAVGGFFVDVCMMDTK